MPLSGFIKELKRERDQLQRHLAGIDLALTAGGRGLSLPLKTGQRLRVSRNLGRKELEGYEAMQPCVLRFIDHTHPATTELLDDAVVRNGLADHLRECYGVRSGKSMYGLTARE
jgi:hypothetical protein